MDNGFLQLRIYLGQFKAGVFSALFLVSHLLLGLVTLGDIPADSNTRNHNPIIIKNRFSCPSYPSRPVFGDGALFAGTCVRWFAELLKCLHRGFSIILVDQREEFCANQVIFGFPKHIAIRLANEKESSHRVHFNDKVGLILNDNTVLFFTLLELALGGDTSDHAADMGGDDFKGVA